MSLERGQRGRGRGFDCGFFGYFWVRFAYWVLVGTVCGLYGFCGLGGLGGLHGLHRLHRLRGLRGIMHI